MDHGAAAAAASPMKQHESGQLQPLDEGTSELQLWRRVADPDALEVADGGRLHIQLEVGSALPVQPSSGYTVALTWQC